MLAVGIDVSKSKSTVAIIRSDGTVLSKNPPAYIPNPSRLPNHKTELNHKPEPRGIFQDSIHYHSSLVQGPCSAALLRSSIFSIYLWKGRPLMPAGKSSFLNHLNNDL